MTDKPASERDDLLGPDPEAIRELLRNHPALAITGAYIAMTVIGLTYRPFGF